MDPQMNRQSLNMSNAGHSSHYSLNSQNKAVKPHETISCSQPNNENLLSGISLGTKESLPKYKISILAP